MDFHEQHVDAQCRGGARQMRHKLPLASGPASLPARHLHAVGGVENQGVAQLAHLRQAAEIDHQCIVAEAGAALGQQYVSRTAGFQLAHHVPHVPWREELALLHVDGPARAGGGQQQVRLTAEEGRDLQHVHDLCHGCRLIAFVHVRQHRHANLVLDALQNLEPDVHRVAAEGINGGPVGLVERRLENQRDAQAVADLANAGSHLEGKVFGLDNARAADQRQRAVVANLQGVGNAAPDHGRTPCWNSPGASTLAL